MYKRLKIQSELDYKVVNQRAQRAQKKKLWYKNECTIKTDHLPLKI